MHTTRRHKAVAPTTIPLPHDWQDNFKASTIRGSFVLALSRPMLEYLCACADDVRWDRDRLGGNLYQPDNWIATERALIKRGLIFRLEMRQIDTRREGMQFEEYRKLALCQLTPACKAVVELVKLTGMYIEADYAIEKKSRKA